MQRLAVVDDESSMREYLELLLMRAGFAVSVFASPAEFKTALSKHNFALVISDMKMGQASGMDVLKMARAGSNPAEVILITAYGTPAAAVEAMRQGAYDYIAKPFDNEELLLLVQRALEKRALVDENRELKTSAQGHVFAAKSLAMQPVLALVDKVAAAGRTTVLITGESGTGKEVIARSIHLKSARASQPFLAVNCAALAEGVLESELFGHVKGAFTGATGDRVGILVAAKDGTVLLDEVGEMPLATQVKLLRVLQERKVKPVGSSTEIPFEARILTATNRNLETEVAAGRFREDLLFRLNVITIELPPLRARADDIIPLAEHFLAAQARELGRPHMQFTPESLQALKNYRFPGNVRQLQNIVERAATLADGDLLAPDSLPPALLGIVEVADADAVAIPSGFSLERYLDQLERRYLLEGLRKAGGAKMKAAEVLGLSFRSFRYRAAKHGLVDREGSTDTPVPGRG
jgi:two-component system, NtrC family, response regulator PilR